MPLEVPKPMLMDGFIVKLSLQCNPFKKKKQPTVL